MSVEKQWEDFLTPEVTQIRLVTASLYMTAYEILKESIIGRIKDFYCTGFDSSSLTYSPTYQEDVLSLNKHPLFASLQWLQNCEVITQEDWNVFKKLMELRNILAHELSTVIFTGKDLSIPIRMQEALDLLKKIEVWWVVNVEIPTNPDFDGSDIDPDEVTPGPVLMMQIMLEVMAGNKELLEHYRKAKVAKETPTPDAS